MKILSIAVLPQISPLTFGDDEVNLDDAVSAVCTITKGDAPIKIWWTLSNEDDVVPRNISTNDGVVIAKTGNKLSLLNIESVQRRHRGNYTCWAKNKAGIAHYSTQLAINGAQTFSLPFPNPSNFLRFVSLAFCFPKFFRKFCRSHLAKTKSISMKL